MTRATARRDFLLSTCVGAVAGVTALNPNQSRAIEPIKRPKNHHFKFSMAAYSYRDLLKANPPKLSLIDFIDDCSKLNLDGTELTSYYLPEAPTSDELRQLKGEAFRRGLDISGTAIRNDFCVPPGEQRDKELAHVKRWIEYADQLDAPVIRIFAGQVKPGQSNKEAQRLCAEGIEECCRHAAKYGVFLALENHGGITAEVDNILAIVRAVQSPWFGVNMDTGNFNTADPYGDLAKLAPYSVNVQVKVLVQPAGKSAEPSDFGRLADILRTAGYRGYVVLEFEAPGEPSSECAHYVEQLRKAFA
jgi:sugar phosphate isomerase/epimerase